MQVHFPERGKGREKRMCHPLKCASISDVCMSTAEIMCLGVCGVRRGLPLRDERCVSSSLLAHSRKKCVVYSRTFHRRGLVRLRTMSQKVGRGWRDSDLLGGSFARSRAVSVSLQPTEIARGRPADVAPSSAAKFARNLPTSHATRPMFPSQRQSSIRPATPPQTPRAHGVSPAPRPPQPAGVPETARTG